MKKFLTFLFLAATFFAASAKGTFSQRQESGKPACGLSARAKDVVPAASSFSTRTYNLRDFNAIDVGNVVKVVYSQGTAYSVKLTGRADLLSEMEVKVKDGALKVSAKRTKRLSKLKKKDMPDGTHHFILHLTAPRLERIFLSGVSTFETSAMTSENLLVRLGGVSKLNVDRIECPEVNLSVSGCSHVRVKTLACSRYDADVSGASKVDIQKVAAEDTRTKLSGASKADLPSFSTKGTSVFSISGASKLNLTASDGRLLQTDFSGASKGHVSFKGDALRVGCSGASKLAARLDCQSVRANCDGASKINLSGTADKVEVERGGVATNIDTSQLNRF